MQCLFGAYYIYLVSVVLTKHMRIIVTSNFIMISADLGTPVVDYCGHASHIDSIRVICIDIISTWSDNEG